MSSEKNHNVIQSLNRLLASSYVLFVKTQNYHWNVTGPHFGALHTMFEEQYNELFAANDEIAERIRALGEKAPGSFAAFAALSAVKEETGNPSATEMLKTLAQDHETLASAADAVVKAAMEIGDDATADLAIGRIEAHQKAHWMLDAHLR